MADLEFRYGPMNSGKSMNLLQTAYNYEENNKKVILIKFFQSLTYLFFLLQKVLFPRL